MQAKTWRQAFRSAIETTDLVDQIDQATAVARSGGFRNAQLANGVYVSPDRALNVNGCRLLVAAGDALANIGANLDREAAAVTDREIEDARNRVEQMASGVTAASIFRTLRRLELSRGSRIADALNCYLNRIEASIGVLAADPEEDAFADPLEAAVDRCARHAENGWSFPGPSRLPETMNGALRQQYEQACRRAQRHTLRAAIEHEPDAVRALAELGDVTGVGFDRAFGDNADLYKSAMPKPRFSKAS